MKILVVSGPNLDLLGTREPHIYGTATLADIHRMVEEAATAESTSVSCMQSNHEGDLVTAVGQSRAHGFDGVVLNAAAYTHTSLAIYDAIKASAVPTVEVHISNPAAREAFRSRSRIASACIGHVAGFGPLSYVLGFRGLLAHLRGLKP